MADVFGNAVIESHLASFEKRHAGSHVVEDGGCLEGVLNIDGALVLFGEFEQLFTGFGKAGEDVGLHLFSGRDVQSATHGHDGVQCGADGT